MKGIHKAKLKNAVNVHATGEAGQKKVRHVSTVGFPWKWVGVGAVVFIIILAVVIIKPVNLGGNNPGTVPAECINGKSLQVDFTVTLHVLVTDYRTGKNNYTHMIPNGIGMNPVDGQDCTRRVHTGYDYTPTAQPARIKVQSPEQGDFTLGDFFMTWDNQTLGPDKVLTYWTPDWRIVFKVNGVTIDDTNLNTPYHYENFKLIADQNIEFYVIYVA